MINKGQGLFTNYTVEGFVHSINIRKSNGTGCEIDVFAKLASKGKRKGNFALLAEVKCRQKLVAMEEAEKFISTIKKAVIKYDLNEVKSFYISKNGFKEGVQEYLQSFGIQCANSEEVFMI